MSRTKLLNRIKFLEKARTTGKNPLLFEAEFKEAFVDAVIENEGNGSRIFHQLVDNGFEVSYKTIQEYVRRVLGTYPVTGRPAKYLKSHTRKGIV